MKKIELDESDLERLLDIVQGHVWRREDSEEGWEDNEEREGCLYLLRALKNA